MAATTSSSWETVKKHSRQLSSSPLKSLRSPSKDIKFSKFHDHTVPITLSLDGNELIFEDHMWKLASAGSTTSNSNTSMNQLKQQNKLLQDENSMLKFKIEVMLDMLTATKLDHLDAELELAAKSKKS